MDIVVRRVKTKSSAEAEDLAIKKALELYPGDEPIFSDCKTAVALNLPRAKWIPRESNRDADRFGNVRLKENPHEKEGMACTQGENRIDRPAERRSGEVQDLVSHGQCPGETEVDGTSAPNPRTDSSGTDISSSDVPASQTS